LFNTNLSHLQKSVRALIKQHSITSSAFKLGASSLTRKFVVAGWGIQSDMRYVTQLLGS
jgi:hypothetical protein